jgi:hypothetical protein
LEPESDPVLAGAEVDLVGPPPYEEAESVLPAGGSTSLPWWETANQVPPTPSPLVRTGDDSDLRGGHTVDEDPRTRLDQDWWPSRRAGTVAIGLRRVRRVLVEPIHGEAPLLDYGVQRTGRRRRAAPISSRPGCCWRRRRSHPYQPRRCYPAVPFVKWTKEARLTAPLPAGGWDTGAALPEPHSNKTAAPVAKKAARIATRFRIS